MTSEPYRALPYADPTGDTAAARADNYTTSRPRKDRRAFQKVNPHGIPKTR